MRKSFNAGAAGLAVTLVAGCGAGDNVAASRVTHLNPMIALHVRGEPVFGLYAPRATPARRDGASQPPETRTPAERAQAALAYEEDDYLFVGSMEDGVERGLPAFHEFMTAMRDAGASARNNPLVVKMEKIADDPEAATHIGQQLNAGVSGIVFVHVESAEELRRGIEAMRLPSDGGTRSDDVGSAPAYWGLTAEEYRRQADLWPLDPAGELVAWAVVESEEGLAHVREIAAVPGLGVLFPGAGTLRRVFSTTGPDGERIVDETAWENAIQQVLSACKDFDVLCGYPADADDIEMRMEQGFIVFVMGWGDDGFETVTLGRRMAGR